MSRVMIAGCSGLFAGKPSSYGFALIYTEVVPDINAISTVVRYPHHFDLNPNHFGTFPTYFRNGFIQSLTG
jgi:hypothetical protein